MQHITTRKKAEERLMTSLREKESLVQELQHRVMNNLQFASSLLALQTPNLRDEWDRKLVRESLNRFTTMAIIHEDLYYSPDHSRIDFTSCVRNLATHLIESRSRNLPAVDLRITAGDMLLDMDIAIPCGLIMAELVDIALQHAFTGEHASPGEVCIQVEATPTRLHLSVKDNGKGLPEGFELTNAPSFGFRMIRLLAEQLDAVIEVSSGVGTAVTISCQRATTGRRQE